mgnify:CR=1 FL=1
MYGKGISKVGEILDLAVKYDIIHKSGAWFSYNENRLGQGRDNVKNYISEHPDFMAELEAQVRERLMAENNAARAAAKPAEKPAPAAEPAPAAMPKKPTSVPAQRRSLTSLLMTTIDEDNGTAGQGTKNTYTCRRGVPSDRYPGFWASQNIRSGDEIDDAEFAAFCEAAGSCRAFNAAVDILSRRDHSSRELQQKVARRSGAEFAREAVERLKRWAMSTTNAMPIPSRRSCMSGAAWVKNALNRS